MWITIAALVSVGVWIIDDSCVRSKLWRMLNCKDITMPSWAMRLCAVVISASFDVESGLKDGRAINNEAPRSIDTKGPTSKNQA